jgi:DNA primase
VANVNNGKKCVNEKAMSEMNDFIHELHDRVLLSSYIGRYVKLQRIGANHKGLCPFHSEKTPSFNVVDGKKFYHCFGCGAHGRLIDFAMQFHSLSFMDALRQLAEMYNMEIPVRSTEPNEWVQDIQQPLLALNEEAMRWFRQAWFSSASEAARRYMAQRGMDTAIIEQCMIGYAPAQGGVVRHLLSKGAVIEQLLVLGLASRHHQRDMFSDRIMFPILNGRGQCVGFGGRVIHGGEPKYLNSVDSPIFKKKELLYGESWAKQAMIKHKKAILVEGYLDVMALQQAGIGYVVAGLGTAIGVTHVQRLWNYGVSPYICLDGDNAGLKATYRLLLSILPYVDAEKTLYFIDIPDNLDPDDTIKRVGASGFEAYVTKAVPLSEMLWNYVLRQHPQHSAEEYIRIENTIKQLVVDIKDPVSARHYRQFLQDRLWQRRRYSEKPSSSSSYVGSYKKNAVEDVRHLRPLAPISHDGMLEMASGRLIAWLLVYPYLLSEEVIDQLCSLEWSTVLQPLIHEILALCEDSFVQHEEVKELQLALEGKGWDDYIARILNPIYGFIPEKRPVNRELVEKHWEYLMAVWRLESAKHEQRVLLDTCRSADTMSQQMVVFARVLAALGQEVIRLQEQVQSLSELVS